MNVGKRLQRVKKRNMGSGRKEGRNMGGKEIWSGKKKNQYSPEVVL